MLRGRIAITTVRRAALRWRARLFALGLIVRGRDVAVDGALAELAAVNRLAAGGLSAPTLLVSFHGPGLYGLIRCIGLFELPVLVLGTPAAVRVMTLARRLGILPSTILFKEQLSSRDIARLRDREAVLLVFCDTSLSSEAMFHVVIGGRVHAFSGAWAMLAERIGARIVCLRSLRRDGTVRVDHRALGAGLPAFATIRETFDFLFDTTLAPGDWDFAISDWLYPRAQSLTTSMEPYSFVATLSATHPDLQAVLRDAAR